MPLVEHLKELRLRLIYSVLAFFAAGVLGFIWYQTAPPGIAPLGEIMRGPYCSLPPEFRADFTGDGECRLLATSPFEMFLLRLRVSALVGIILSSPIWLYQIWAFITPGLHKNERRWTFTFVSLAVILFVTGAVMAYFVIDMGLYFLLTIGEEAQVAALTGKEYYGFVLAFVVIFGACFEVPLIIVMLNILGILEYRSVRGKRRIIWVITYVIAAPISPGGDPFSMLALGTSVGLLIELAFQFCKWNDKRRGVSLDDDLADLDDEKASELDYQPEPIEPANPTAPVTKANFDDVL
ncbi:twin-arginine translocase subunit TatC [Corynebacterium tapiri]|uniref:Sec-independent protein translocase protein TatC n=2 Tax=Corynebacterium tapiri TaxID=1448266 RepID=A0A5C4U588_9CORY|nr:twin-arginine translocase subunit TatC [Corynebacterium tapiri]